MRGPQGLCWKLPLLLLSAADLDPLDLAFQLADFGPGSVDFVVDGLSLGFPAFGLRQFLLAYLGVSPGAPDTP